MTADERHALTSANGSPPAAEAEPARTARPRRTLGARLARGSLPAVLVAAALALAVPLDQAGESLDSDFLDTAAAETTAHDIDVFYAPLAAHGRWVAMAPYGYVWVPTGVAPGWRPYTLGQWLWTDRYGWLWASDEPFGWAVYHYGRWGYDKARGWFWVPGDRWAPAWVTWREGDETIGWAPLAPEGKGPALGVPRRQQPPVTEAWVFVPSLRFAQPRLYLYAAPVRETYRSLDRAPLRWSYPDTPGEPVNRPFDRDWLRRHNGQLDLPATSVDFVSEPAATRRSPGRIRLYRPVIEHDGAVLPPPAPAVADGTTLTGPLIGETAVRQLAPAPPKPKLKLPIRPRERGSEGTAPAAGDPAAAPIPPAPASSAAAPSSSESSSSESSSAGSPAVPAAGAPTP